MAAWSLNWLTAAKPATVRSSSLPGLPQDAAYLHDFITKNADLAGSR
jgi:hypothetical protein